MKVGRRGSGESGRKRGMGEKNQAISIRVRKQKKKPTNHRKHHLTAPAPPKLFSLAEVGRSHPQHQAPAGTEGTHPLGEGRRLPAYRKKLPDARRGGKPLSRKASPRCLPATGEDQKLCLLCGGPLLRVRWKSVQEREGGKALKEK